MNLEDKQDWFSKASLVQAFSPNSKETARVQLLKTGHLTGKLNMYLRHQVSAIS